MKIRQFFDAGLGNSAHLIVSERAGLAALVDPLRDVDQYLDVARREGVQISHVFETHIHNDFVSGSRELASRTGAHIVASADAELEFEHQAVRDGDTISVGDVRFTVLATPGHTPEHVSFLAEDPIADTSEPPVLLSGGSLLVGAVSRTDLLGHEHATGLAHQLYRSLHDKILPLGDEVVVYPTHGAGSFCTADAGAGSTTIGRERRTNPLLAVPGPEAFATRLLASMPTYPTYFLSMRALNRRGPPVLGHVPRLARLTALEVQARQRRGEAVVDMRSVYDYARGHIPGVYHVELRPAFGSWVGWVVPLGTPVVLVSGESSELHHYAVRQLIRIGYDDLPGYLEGMDGWERAGLPVERVPLLTMRAVRERLQRGEPLVVVDVRQVHEWAAGHLPRAELVEAGALPYAELNFPRDGLLATHCGHGQRAATGLSVLEQRGYRNLALIAEGIDEWRTAGGEVERGTFPERVPR
jgi:hydroxyacylglutathione hydrolase